MGKRLTRLLILAITAFILSPLLKQIVPFPTENMVSGLIDPSSEFGSSILTILRFPFWMLALNLFAKISAPFFGWMVPTSRQYSITKPVRRFSGITAEIGLFLSLLFILSSLFALFPIGNAYNSLVDKTIKEQSISTSAMDIATELQSENQSSFSSLRTELISTAESGNRYLNNKDRYDPFGRNLYFHIPSKDQLKQTGNWKKIKSPIRGISRDWYVFEGKNLSSNFQSQTLTFLMDKNNPYKHKERLSNDTNYLSYRIEYNRICYELEKLANQDIQQEALNAYAKIEDANAALPRQAHKAAWGIMLADPIGTYWDGFSKAWLWALVPALIIYALSHLPYRYSLAKRYEKVLRFLAEGRLGLGGSARFAGLVEEWSSLFKSKNQSLFMGRSLYNPFIDIGLEDPRHMLTIAGSRAGKGTTAIIPNLLLWEGSAIVVDPKGTNAAVTARRRREMGQNVYLVDPFNIVQEDESDAFNPLDMLKADSPTIREDIQVIADALVVPNPDQKDKHWDDGARTLLAGMIAHMVSGSTIENPSLPQVRRFFSMSNEEQIEFWADMSLDEGAGGLAKEAAARIIRGIGTNEILSILSNADKHSEWLASERIAEALSKSTFNFAEMKESPTTIYLILPPHYLETHNRFLRLFINLAINQMSHGGRAKVPVLMLMDEFLALGRMKEVEKAFGLMAGYNLVLWPFVQDLGRLKDLYNKSVNAFITNSRAVQVFGVTDEETTEFVSKQLGNKALDDFWSEKMKSKTASLRDPNEVAFDVAADSGRQYIIRAGKAPFLLEKVPYYDPGVYWKPGAFEGLYDKDPDYS